VKKKKPVRKRKRKAHVVLDVVDAHFEPVTIKPEHVADLRDVLDEPVVIVALPKTAWQKVKDFLGGN
jgi:hypothetical protein